jgi:hypothetical protein
MLLSFNLSSELVVMMTMLMVPFVSIGLSMVIGIMQILVLWMFFMLLF